MELQNSTVHGAEHPKIEVFGALPCAIESRLTDALRKVQRPLLNSTRLQETREAVRLRQVPNYELDWASFSYLYYGANFAKSYIVARTALMPQGGKKLHIVDLGCGGGASTVGIISALERDTSLEGRVIGKMTVVDRSPHQLALFEQVASPWIRQEFPEMELDIRQNDIFNFLEDKSWGADLVILSYVTCEFSEEDNHKLRQLLRKRTSEQSMQVWIIETDIQKQGVSVELLTGRCFTVPYDKIFLSFRCLESLDFSIKPKFSNSTNSDLLHQYFDAWKTHDTNAIRNIFSVTATYDIVGRKVLHGVDEIAAYWDRNKLNQRNVECGVHRIIVTKGGLTAVWWAKFERVDYGELRQLEGMMSITIDNGQITSLVEAYTQTINTADTKKSDA